MGESVTARFINFSKPFISCTKNVFETMVYTKINSQAPLIKKEKITKGDITSTIGINGEGTIEGKNRIYRGMLIISYPEETYIKVASAMLMEEHTEYNSEIADVGGEIVNMIVGNAKRNLNELGYTASMAIPSMVRGKNHEVRYPESTTVVQIPCESDHGLFYLEVAYWDEEK